VEADLVVGPLVDLVVLRPGADLQQVTAAAVRVDLQQDTAAAVRVDLQQVTAAAVQVDLQQDTAAAVAVDLLQDTAAAVRVDLQQVTAAAVQADLQQVMAAEHPPGHLLEASQEPSFFLLPKLDWVQPVVDQEQVPWDSEAACQDPPDLERDLVLVRLALAPDCNSVLRVDQGEALRASDKAQVARGLAAVHPFRISSR
jgi:hypothetical protein